MIFYWATLNISGQMPWQLLFPLNWLALLSSADKHCVCPVLYCTVLCLPCTLLSQLSSKDALGPKLEQRTQITLNAQL